MSALEPEVGDVWRNPRTRKKIVILAKPAAIYQCLIEGSGMVQKWTDDFRNMEYIGKSKASIDDLFCVKENAENYTQTDLRKIDDMQKKIEFAKQAVDLFFKTEDESKLLEIAEWE